MFNLAVLLIALGAVVGLYMAVQHFRGRTPPRGLAAATQHMNQKRLSSPVIVIHALVAVIAFLMTVAAVYLLP